MTEKGPTLRDIPVGIKAKGDRVEFWSETHKEWIPAKINATDEHGKVKLNAKPNVWLSMQVQGEQVRPREKKPAAAEKENQGSVAGGESRPGLHEAGAVRLDHDEVEVDEVDCGPNPQRTRI